MMMTLVLMDLLSGLPDPLASHAACMASADEYRAGADADLTMIAWLEASVAHGHLEGPIRDAYTALEARPDNRNATYALMVAACREVAD